MGQNVLTIQYSDELLRSMELSREAFSKEARFLLAAKLYEIGRLSSSEAAHMAGLGRVDFLLSLNRIGVPMSNLGSEDIASDIDFALNG